MTKRTQQTKPIKVIGDLTDQQILDLPASKRRDHFFKKKISRTLFIKIMTNHQTQLIINPNTRIPMVLGEIYQAVVKKTGGMPSWRGYSPDYKEQMEGLGTIHLCKYGTCFDLKKSKNKDPLSYLIQICWRAFQQALKREKIRSDIEGAEFTDLMATELEQIAVEIDLDLI